MPVGALGLRRSGEGFLVEGRGLLGGQQTSVDAALGLEGARLELVERVESGVHFILRVW